MRMRGLEPPRGSRGAGGGCRQVAGSGFVEPFPQTYPHGSAGPFLDVWARIGRRHGRLGRVLSAADNQRRQHEGRLNVNASQNVYAARAWRLPRCPCFEQLTVAIAVVLTSAVISATSAAGTSRVARCQSYDSSQQFVFQIGARATPAACLRTLNKLSLVFNSRYGFNLVATPLRQIPRYVMQNQCTYVWPTHEFLRVLADTGTTYYQDTICSDLAQIALRSGGHAARGVG